MYLLADHLYRRVRLATYRRADHLTHLYRRVRRVRLRIGIRRGTDFRSGRLLRQ